MLFKQSLSQRPAAGGDGRCRHDDAGEHGRDRRCAHRPNDILKFSRRMPTPRRLFLIDGSSQMYRAYHAPVRTAEGGFLRNAQGRPTNAVYIFVTMLRKLFNEMKPEYIAASFDLPGRTFRDDLVSDYKANRTPMPDELAEQIPMVHAACEALGVPILTSRSYEADDVLGTLAEKA